MESNDVVALLLWVKTRGGPLVLLHRRGYFNFEKPAGEDGTPARESWTNGLQLTVHARARYGENVFDTLTRGVSEELGLTRGAARRLIQDVKLIMGQTRPEGGSKKFSLEIKLRDFATCPAVPTWVGFRREELAGFVEMNALLPDRTAPTTETVLPSDQRRMWPDDIEALRQFFAMEAIGASCRI